MSSTPFEISVSVMPGDIDEQNHVNNTVYLRWVQEVATAHWQAIASSEAQEGIGWVVLRHEIDYKTSACLGDAVVLRTWVGKATRLTFERFTEIRRSSDGQLLSTARTLWCPINAQTGRPVRVPSKCASSFRFKVIKPRPINDAVMFERSETSLFWVVARRCRITRDSSLRSE
jgi:acyl-CoA thioester hydrolase